MAEEVLTSRFFVAERTNENTMVSTLILKNKQSEIILDVHSDSWDIYKDDSVELILFKGHVDDDLAKEYNYVMLGNMYEVNDTTYIGSFGGLKFEMKTDETVDLNDRCLMSIALKKL